MTGGAGGAGRAAKRDDCAALSCIRAVFSFIFFSRSSRSSLWVTYEYMMWCRNYRHNCTMQDVLCFPLPLAVGLGCFKSLDFRDNFLQQGVRDCCYCYYEYDELDLLDCDRFIDWDKAV